MEVVQVLSVNDGHLQNSKVTKNVLSDLANVTNLSLVSIGIQTIDDDAFCETPLLTHLDLTRNNITLTSSTFDCLPDLLILELASNAITELPEGVFKQLKKLRVLQLWSNHLKTLNHNIFNGLSELALLELSNNQLEELASGVFDSLIGLKQLNLNNNRLKVVPDNLFSATINLQKIRWDSNKGLQLQENAFSNLAKLETISLSENGLVSLPERIFLNSTSLLSVNFARNRIRTLPETLLDGLDKLKSLDLSVNQLESLEKATFKSLKSLESLFLQNNKLQNINKELFDNLSGLRLLRLDYNQIATLPMLNNLYHLKSLNVSHNKIYFEENSLGVTPLNPCTELEELDLSHNEIAEFEEDFEIVLVKLKLLDLSFNRLTHVEVKGLQRMDTHERRINLANNNITIIDFSDAELMAKLQDRLDIMSSNLFNTVVCISNNPIACDCRNYDLFKYYHDRLDPRVPTMVTILKEDVYCASSDYLVAKLPAQSFTCDLSEVVNGFECPQNCSCEWRPFNNGIAFNCANANLATLPKVELPDDVIHFEQLEVDLKLNKLKSGPSRNDSGYENVTRLLLSHNEIEYLEWLPPRLEVCKVTRMFFLCFNSKFVFRF